jgi:hypothetical protein
VDRNNTGYNLTQAFLLEGFLDTRTLEEAFKRLIRRREILRTSIVVVDGEPVQRIQDIHDIQFTVNYYEWEEGDIQEKIKRFVKPFAPGRAPLFRVGLITLAESKHILMIDTHHLITDAISNFIFIRDLQALYRDEPLPELEYQYRDYAQWENSDRHQENVKVQEAYWLRQFEGELPILDMPVDFPRPAVKDYKGEVVSVDLGEELSNQLNQLAKETGTTMYMVLLSAYNILLSKYTRQEDIVVGAAVPGRRHSDLQNIMGMFVNMLAVRNHPHGPKTYKEFLSEVKENVLEAFENQDYPFERLVKKLGLQGSLNRNPLFDTALVMDVDDPTGMDNADFQDNGQLKVTPYEIGRRGSVFDMVLLAGESRDKITLQFTYSTALFKRSKIEKIAKHYIEIMEQIAADGHIELKDISISHELLKVKSKILQEDQQDFGF